MPNGDPNWMKDEYPKLEEFFRKIASVITCFAKLHNLKINKYYHQFPSWDLQFRHPIGGIGQIEIGRADENNLDVFICWWKDNFEKNLRYSKNGEKQIITVGELSKNFLENKFREIISWSEADLKPFPAGCDWSKHATKEKFEAQINEYPIPKLN